MSLGKLGSWSHPCQPWLDLHPDVSRRLLPGGREASRSQLEARARDLDGWKVWPEFASLVERVRREQGQGQADRLARVVSGDLVVLTGQQPSFAGGPMFVWLKAWSAIRHAERATQLLGRPVQALFWIAGDDSDLEEVRGLADPFLKRSFDAHPQRPGRQRFPVGSLAIDPATRERLAAEIASAWPGSVLTNLVAEAADLSSLMAGCLRHWFGERLLVVDAAWSETRTGASVVYREFARSPAGIHADLAAGMERARAAGLPVSLQSWPDRLRLFHWSHEGRARIVRDGDDWTDGIARWTDDTLQDALRDEPERFSHDVASRPFACQAIFPVLAHVLGPGEFSYFACLGPLSSRLGRTLAPALPRASATILPAGPWKVALEAGWDPVRTPPGPIQAMQDVVLDRRSPRAGLWPKLWADARADYLDALSEGVGLEDLKGLDRTLAGFERRWRTTLLRKSAPRHRGDLDELRRLASVAGQGGLQERLWSPWALEHHLGDPGFLGSLEAVTDPVETVHALWEHRDA
jgi:hypothetical protein